MISQLGEVICLILTIMASVGLLKGLVDWDAGELFVAGLGFSVFLPLTLYFAGVITS